MKTKTGYAAPLTPEECGEMYSRLVPMIVGALFGDGQEEEYVMGGFPEMRGLGQLTDEELLAEWSTYMLDACGYCGDDTHDEEDCPNVKK